MSIQKLAASALIVAVVGLGVTLTNLTFAATGSLTLTPNTGSATVGKNLTLTLKENSGSDAAIGVTAKINYPASQLQFVSASTVAPFNVAPPETVGGGSVEITRGAYSGQTGEKIVSVIVFKVINSGTATVSFSTGASSISSASNNSDLLTASPSATFTLKAASTGSTGGTTTPPPTTTPKPTPETKKPTTPKTKSVTITPKSSSSGTTVGDNGSAAVASTVEIEPTTVQTEGVTKIEYYIDNELVNTQTKAPYKYSVDTTKLKNGTHNLQIKTYYSNGTTKTSAQKLLVKNAAAKRSPAVGIGYAVILLLIIGGTLAILLRKRGGIDGHYTAVAPETIVTSANPAPVQVKPTPAPMANVPAQPVKPAGNNLPEPGTVIQHNATPEDK